MNDIKDSVIVAIELGSSRIAGIAGKMKDGTAKSKRRRVALLIICASLV